MHKEIPEVIKYDRERKSRLNTRELTIVRDYLVDRDGNACKICGRVPPEVTLEVDHVDSNKHRHFHKNLQLLCRRDNSRKNPRGKKHKKGVDYEIEVHTLKASRQNEEFPKSRSLEFMRNHVAEPKFRHFVYEEMSSKTRMLYDEVVDGGAEESGIQIERAQKYLRKMVSCRGQFRVVTDEVDGEKYVMWKDRYNPFKDLEKKVTE